MPSKSHTTGGITVALGRPPSKLAKHRDRIRALLGRDLPDELVAFYAEGDGLRYRATGPDGELVGDACEILGLERVFAKFRPHRPVRSIEAFEEDDEMSDQPFYEELWNEEFELESRRDLDRLNALKRSKVLVSIPGESAWLTVDLLDPKHAPYRLGLAEDARELHPLELSFADFVACFSRFGVSRWYLAFAGKKAEAAMNIDFAAELEKSLAPFSSAWPEEVDALVARVRPTRRKRSR
jgi:hypothetical protein